MNEPPIVVDSVDLEHLAEIAFRLSGETGNDAALFWKISALRFAEVINEFEFVDVFEAAGRCYADRKPAFVRQCFRELMRKRETPLDAEALVRSVRITPRCPTSKPDPL